MRQFSGTFEEIVRRSAEQLNALVVAERQGDQAAPDRPVEGARAEFRQRLAAATQVARTAWEELSRLAVAATELDRIAQFTEEGWPERRAHLAGELSTDPAAGVRSWLVDVIMASSRRRSAAVRRLCDGGLELPPGTAVLLDRCRALATGLEEPSYELAAGFLGPVAAQTRSTHELGVDRRTLGDVAVLLARLALVGGHADDAEHWIAEARRLGAPAPGWTSAQAWLARISDPAGDAVAEALETGAWQSSLDLAVEAIHRAAASPGEDLATLPPSEIAAEVVSALPSLVDIDIELARLVEEPPPELWLAVADRARLEGDLELTQSAVDRAEAGAPSGAYELAAAINDHRAALAGHRGQSGDQARWLREAAKNMSWAGKLQEARQRFTEAGNLDPTDIEVPLRLADIANQEAWAAPVFADALSWARMGRSLIEGVRERSRISLELSWAYAVDASLCEVQAREMSAGRWDSYLGSLRSAALFVAHDVGESWRWTALARAAEAMNLYGTAQVAIDAARALSGALDVDEQLRQEAVKRAVNQGDIAEARRVLAQLEDAIWQGSVQAHLDLRDGKFEEAASALATVASSPDDRMTWQVTNLLYALALSDLTAAIATSETIVELATNDRHRDDYGWAGVAVFAMLLLDRLDDAVGAARRMATIDRQASPGGDGSVPSELAMVLLLQGQADEGLAVLRANLAHRQSGGALDDWSSLERPLLERLASRRGVGLPDLSVVDEVIEARRGVLLARTDVGLELSGCEIVGSDPVAAQATLGLVGALVHLARTSDPGPLRELLPRETRLGVAEEERRAMTDQVATSWALLARKLDPTRAPGLARRVVEACQAGRTDEALTHLRRLLELDYFDTDEHLRAAGLAGAELAVVLDLLGSLAADEELGSQAVIAAAYLRAWAPDDGLPEPDEVVEPPEAAVLEVHVPPSWFVGMSEHGTEHDILRRYLSETTRLMPQLPRVNVATDDRLEPDGYRLLVRGTVVEEAAAPRDRRYLPEAALALLPVDIRAHALPGGPGGLSSIPADMAHDAGVLTGLLTLAADEAVIRRLIQPDVLDVAGAARENSEHDQGRTPDNETRNDEPDR